jgi:hypothetical protein
MNALGIVVSLGYYIALIAAIGGLVRLSICLAVLSVDLWSMAGGLGPHPHAPAVKMRNRSSVNELSG